MLNKKLLLTLLGSVVITACSSQYSTNANRYDLDVQTSTSPKVFVNNTANSAKTVYVQVSNSSGVVNVDLATPLKAYLEKNQYQVVYTLNDADYLVQADVIKLSEASGSASGKAFSMITDVKLSVRNGDSHDITNWNRYRTRVVAKADNASVDLAKAEPALSNDSAKAISAIF